MVGKTRYTLGETLEPWSVIGYEKVVLRSTYGVRPEGNAVLGCCVTPERQAVLFVLSVGQ